MMMANASKARMFRSRIVFLQAVLFFAIRTGLGAQEVSVEELPGLRERAVVMRIVSRIVEQNQQVVWNSENSRVTIPGRPVGLKLVGTNLVVAVQFTPFLQPNGQHILVAQGQIWINVPDEGIRYHTTIQTIPLGFNEQVYFFPLGPTRTQDEAHIEIQLMLEPYSGNPGEGPRNRNSPPGEGPRGRGSPSEGRQGRGSVPETPHENSGR